MQDVIAVRDNERIVAVGGIPPKEKDAATQAFEWALVQKLKAILERPLSSQVLLELEMSARLGRQFLMMSEGPAAMPRQGFGMGGYGGIGSIGGYGDPFEGPLGGVLAQSPQSETFGAGVLRELIAKIGEANPNKRPPALGDLMDAMRMAEKSGKTDLVEKFQKEIDRQLAQPDEELDEDAVHALATGVEDDPPHGLRHVPEAVNSFKGDAA